MCGKCKKDIQHSWENHKPGEGAAGLGRCYIRHSHKGEVCAQTLDAFLCARAVSAWLAVCRLCRLQRPFPGSTSVWGCTWGLCFQRGTRGQV